MTSEMNDIIHHVSGSAIDWEGTYGISDAPSMGFTPHRRFPPTVRIYGSPAGERYDLRFERLERLFGGAVKHVIYRGGPYTIHVYDA